MPISSLEGLERHIRQRRTEDSPEGKLGPLERQAWRVRAFFSSPGVETALCWIFPCRNFPAEHGRYPVSCAPAALRFSCGATSVANSKQ